MAKQTSFVMEQCGGDAARVLREYTYFSVELKDIFTKVAEIQAIKSKLPKKIERER